MKKYYNLVNGGLLHRQGVQALRSANSPFSYIILLNSSFQYKQSSSYNTTPSIEKHGHDDTGYDLLSPHWKLVVYMDPGNPSASSARMLPFYPNQNSSEGKLFSGGFIFSRSVEDDKKQGHRPLNGTQIQEMMAIPSFMPSSLDTSGTTSLREIIRLREMKGNVLGSSKKGGLGLGPSSLDTVGNTSLREIKRLSEMKGKGLGSRKKHGVGLDVPPGKITVKNTKVKLENMEDTRAHEKLPSYTLTSSSKLDSISRKGTLSSSFSQGQMGYDQTNRQAPKPPYKTSIQEQICYVKSEGKADLVPDLISEDCDSDVTLFAERDCRVNEYTVMNNMHDPAPDISRYMTSSSTKVFRNTVLSNAGSRILRIQNREEHMRNFKLSGNRNGATDAIQRHPADGTITNDVIAEEEHGVCLPALLRKLACIFEKVLVVDNISAAKKIVGMLTNQYRHLVHACDTQVAKIDVKQETPVDHGEITCFSIYSGPEANFGNGKSCIWVDVLDGGGKNLLVEFSPFFEDPSIKKVWHNYSFDNHVIGNYALKVSGFHADTMHMARLWDSSRHMEGGYSLEALTADPKVMSWSCHDEELIGKMSIETVFGRRNVKKDGSKGKIKVAPIEGLQREERKSWICYSALDSMSTLKLYESLKKKLSQMAWILNGVCKGSMFDFYERYWQKIGELLVKMETEGLLVDRAYLAEVEKVAKAEQQVAADKFCSWASRYCPDAKYMNVRSEAQLRQLFFGGTINRKDRNKSLPEVRTFKVPNIDNVCKEGKKTATEFLNITLHRICDKMRTGMYTATGWPSVSASALKILAEKVSAESEFVDDSSKFQSNDNVGNALQRMTVEVPETTDEVTETERLTVTEDMDTSTYGKAYAVFGGGQEGVEACHAIAALCEVCSIDSLISFFILPLQDSHMSGKNGRIHCSLDISTETGHVLARRPNLQRLRALKDRYKIRQAFIAAPGNSLIVANYDQLDIRILAHLANCRSMLDAFKHGGDFHSRTAMSIYPYVREAVEQKQVLLEWHPQPGEDHPPVPLLKDAFTSEVKRARVLNLSIAYGKTPVELARDRKASVNEKETVNLWSRERKEVLWWQEERKREVHQCNCVHTLLGRVHRFPSMDRVTPAQKSYINRAAVSAPLQGSAADVVMCAMLEISKNSRLKDLGWRLLLPVTNEIILEGPTESAKVAKAIVVKCMSKPFDGKNILKVDLSVDARYAQNWYSAK